MKNKIIAFMFIAYLMFFTVGSIVSKDRGFSSMENRNLAQFPEVSKESIMSGEFSDQFEKYMSDQIILKDTLVRIKVLENRVLGQTLINDTYFANGDMLIAKYDNPYSQLSTNISYVNEFAKANEQFNITWLVVPNACLIYEDKLPAYAVNYDQSEVMDYIEENLPDNIKFVDCTEAIMAEKDEYIYYNTDHHWTMKGAYIGYSELCKSLGIVATPMENYEVVTGSDEFYGTLYSNAPTFNQ
ncbi:MAG: hypothetical protein IJX12_02070, partial [Lachnospiraceae bacterium]|nr:hypothetical protein [Lachnospiraceae bacterium]